MADAGARTTDGDSRPGPDAASEPDSTPLARAGRWLTTIPLTLAFCGLLSLVFAAELLVLSTAGSGAFRFWFVADARPGPAWVLAALAHSPVRPLHLPVNLALLVAFGGMAERRLSRDQYLAVLAAAGLGGTLAQVVSYAFVAPAGSGGTLGASAVALAVTAFAVVDSARTKLATGRWPGETTWVWVLAGSAIAVRRLVLDNVVGVAGVGRYGHLWGVVFGVSVALLVRRDRYEVTADER
jgi:membrane associated rhomboid family serine protease